ncbi:MAG: hypothetical protein ACTSRI_07630 [Promethearchaeota archaeon]
MFEPNFNDNNYRRGIFKDLSNIREKFPHINISHKDGPPPFFPYPPPPFGFHPKYDHHRHPPPPPPFPLDPETFQELKFFFILTILSDNPDGITAYQLESKYKFPRTSVVRLIEKLIEPGFVVVSSSKVSGRSQTLYTLTESGKEHLERLKEIWAGRFANMAELAPFDRYVNPFMRERIFGRLLNYIEEIKSKSDAEDYFRGFRSKLKHEISMIKKKLETLLATKNGLDLVIETVSKQESLNKDEIKDLMEKIQNKIGKK